jgi:hypothetical protein
MSLLETKLKEVVSKLHTQWEESANSNTLNLIQENIELKRENHHMKLRLTELERQLDSMTIKLPGHSQPVTVPIHNIFDILSDDTNSEENLYAEDNRESKQNTENMEPNDIHFIMDFHGNGIDSSKMYRNQEIHMTILGSGEKNIKGAENFCASHKLPKHLIIGVGNNDLDKKPTNSCVAEMKPLIYSVRSKSDNCNIHILPTFERVNQRSFNAKVRQFNKEIEKFCEQSDKCLLIENSLISSADQSLFTEGTNFSPNGKRSFVRI